MSYLRQLVAYTLFGAFVGGLGGAWITLGNPVAIGLMAALGAVTAPVFYVLEPYGEIASCAFTGLILGGVFGVLFMPFIVPWGAVACIGTPAAGLAILFALVAWSFADTY